MENSFFKKTEEKKYIAYTENDGGKVVFQSNTLDGLERKIEDWSQSQEAKIYAERNINLAADYSMEEDVAQLDFVVYEMESTRIH
jgi:hypothetical protein